MAEKSDDGFVQATSLIKHRHHPNIARRRIFDEVRGCSNSAEPNVDFALRHENSITVTPDRFHDHPNTRAEVITTTHLTVAATPET